MHLSPIMNINGFHLDISVILPMIVTMLIILIIARIAVRNLSVDKPSKMQNFMEWVIEFVQGIIGSAMDMKKGKAFISLGVTLIMFIFVSNMLGLPFTVVTEAHGPVSLFGYDIVSADKYAELHNAGKHVALSWWKSPTADAFFSMGLALMVIVMVHFLGITRNTKAYVKHYFQPYWFFLPINIIEQFSKLLTLGMRLFGNIFAGEVLIATIIMAGYAGIVPMVAWQAFSVFVGAIQAFVFVMLTMVYIGQILESHDDHDEAHQH
ncbi:F0F1 ATP synthase subunit A [Paenibacillus sp. N1-5-1-14]|uniref:F0F1 ATP synthase subunit A n=1 Tax=Paenibacillus radicibacter TaxID=2972488 RepID=UPI002159B59B|nr:F0F1 ATP synthase subunit A [Paenibacillus radicibacter]MCR8645095.1 F0F1 ATP synthase subunit A [Paenibacillus radicibacter]